MLSKRNRPLTTYLPRRIRRAIAAALGYFWLPCHECDEPFAGYEWDGTTIQGITGIGLGICWRCRNRWWADARAARDRGLTTTRPEVRTPL